MAADGSRSLVERFTPDRREFLSRLLLTTAYAAPLVASFSLDGLLLQPAQAQASNLCSTSAAKCDGHHSNVMITATVSPQTASQGDTVTYTVTAKNCGPCDAPNVNWRQRLPIGVGFVAVTQVSGPTFDIDTPRPNSTEPVTGSIDTFAAGAVAVFDIQGTVL